MKFSNFYKVLFSLAFVLVVGFIPTTAEASDIVPNEDIYVEAQFETLEYGSWVTRSIFQVPIGVEDYGRDSEVDMSRIDHTEVNSRIRFYFSNFRTDEWLGDLRYFLDFYFEFDVDGQFLSADHLKMNVYTIDVSTDMMSLVYGDISFDVHGSTNFISEFALNKDVNIIVLEFVFNIHEVYGGDIGQDPRFQTWLMYGSTVVRTDKYLPDIPNYGIPDLDFGDLDDIGELRPSGDFAAFLDSLMTYGYILTVLCMGLTLGVIAFVLFGEKK